MWNVKKPMPGLVAIGAGLLTTGFLAVATAAAQSSIHDRRISPADAARMVEAASTEEFPVEVNDLVLEQLNRYLGTPDGREFMRKALAEMKNHEALVIRAIETYGFPRELMAIPLVESGYRNLPPHNRQGHGAGLWMFIATTARNFGLEVNGRTDERLNVALETDAAMRLLGALNLQFKDWRLAVLGYNAGERAVLKGIRGTGSRDAWTLVRKGYGNDPGYLASVMAAILIMRNPSYLD